MAREEYIDLLATADLTDTFPHFLELPAEVRIIIYSGVCVPMPELPRQYPRQPAICRASKQLRNKSLSVFFGLSTFLLTIKNINWFEIPHESGWEVTEESSTSKVDAKWYASKDLPFSLVQTQMLTDAILIAGCARISSISHLCATLRSTSR